jgi:hypothetical protein
VILPLCFLPLVLFSVPLFNNKKQVL